MAKFDISFDKTIAAEGGYSNNAADKGGETYKGISRNNFPDWRGWNLIDNCKKRVGTSPEALNKELAGNFPLQQDVRTFYVEKFWLPNFEYLHQEIADELFDTAVNQGAGTAVKYLQKALNALNRNGSDYADIAEDGGFGSGTLSAYNALIATRKMPSRSEPAIVKVLLKMLNYFQMDRYMKIADKDPSQESFLFGWMERVE